MTKKKSKCAHLHECANIPSYREFLHLQIFLNREMVCSGELCRERPQPATCQSQLSPDTFGLGDRTHRVPKLQSGRGAGRSPAPAYLWNTCRHQGEEDAHGDRWLEARDKETDGDVLLEVPCRQHSQRLWRNVPVLKGVICRELQPTGANCAKVGDPWGTAAHGHPSLWRNTSEGLKLIDEPCQAGI